MSKLTVVQTDLAPPPVGPYSQAIKFNDELLYCSGQIALDPKTGNMVGATAAEQAAQVMDNIEALLKAAGCEMHAIIKTTIFLLDMNDFASVNTVYETKLRGHKPARSTVAVAGLPKGGKVEIEVIASLR